MFTNIKAAATVKPINLAVATGKVSNWVSPNPMTLKTVVKSRFSPPLRLATPVRVRGVVNQISPQLALLTA